MDKKVIKLKVSRDELNELFGVEAVYVGDYMDHEELSEKLSPSQWCSELIADGVRLAVFNKLGDIASEHVTMEFTAHEGMDVAPYIDKDGNIHDSYVPEVSFLPGGDVLDFNIDSSRMTDSEEKGEEITSGDENENAVDKKVITETIPKNLEKISEKLNEDNVAVEFNIYEAMIRKVAGTGIVVTSDVEVVNGRASVGLPTIYIPAEEVCNGCITDRFNILMDSYMCGSVVTASGINKASYILSLGGMDVTGTMGDSESVDGAVKLSNDDFIKLFASLRAICELHGNGVDMEALVDMIDGLDQLEYISDELLEVLMDMGNIGSINLFKEVGLIGNIILGENNHAKVLQVNRDTIVHMGETENEEEEEIIINPHKVLEEKDEESTLSQLGADESASGIHITLAKESDGEDLKKENDQISITGGSNSSIEDIVNKVMGDNTSVGGGDDTVLNLAKIDF